MLWWAVSAMCNSPDINDALPVNYRGLQLRYVCSVDQSFNVIKMNTVMRAALEMCECLTSCVVAHVLNWEGVVVMAETYVPTINAWHVSRPTVTTVSSCLKSFFVRRRWVISPCHGNYSIEFTKIDEFHKISVRNLSLLLELVQSDQCPVFREAILLVLPWRQPTMSSSPSLWSISSRNRKQLWKGIGG